MLYIIWGLLLSLSTGAVAFTINIAGTFHQVGRIVIINWSRDISETQFDKFTLKLAPTNDAQGPGDTADVDTQGQTSGRVTLKPQTAGEFMVSAYPFQQTSATPLSGSNPFTVRAILQPIISAGTSFAGGVFSVLGDQGKFQTKPDKGGSKTQDPHQTRPRRPHPHPTDTEGSPHTSTFNTVVTTESSPSQPTSPVVTEGSGPTPPAVTGDGQTDTPGATPTSGEIAPSVVPSLPGSSNSGSTGPNGGILNPNGKSPVASDDGPPSGSAPPPQDPGGQDAAEHDPSRTTEAQTPGGTPGPGVSGFAAGTTPATNGNPTETSVMTASHHTKSAAPAIVGGVFGALGVLLLLFLGCRYYHILRRRLRVNSFAGVRRHNPSLYFEPVSIEKFSSPVAQDLEVGPPPMMSIDPTPSFTSRSTTPAVADSTDETDDAQSIKSSSSLTTSYKALSNIIYSATTPTFPDTLPFLSIPSPSVSIPSTQQSPTTSFASPASSERKMSLHYQIADLEAALVRKNSNSKKVKEMRKSLQKMVKSPPP